MILDGYNQKQTSSPFSFTFKRVSWCRYICKRKRNRGNNNNNCHWAVGTVPASLTQERRDKRDSRREMQDCRRQIQLEPRVWKSRSVERVRWRWRRWRWRRRRRSRRNGWGRNQDAWLGSKVIRNKDRVNESSSVNIPTFWSMNVLPVFKLQVRNSMRGYVRSSVRPSVCP